MGSDVGLWEVCRKVAGLARAGAAQARDLPPPQCSRQEGHGRDDEHPRSDAPLVERQGQEAPQHQDASDDRCQPSQSLRDNDSQLTLALAAGTRRLAAAAQPPPAPPADQRTLGILETTVVAADHGGPPGKTLPTVPSPSPLRQRAVLAGAP